MINSCIHKFNDNSFVVFKPGNMPLKLVLSRRWVCLVLFINCHIMHGIIFAVPGFQSKCES